jgi:hypothetical protein
MNAELKKIIEKELELDSLSPSEKRTKIMDKIEELKNLQNYLNEINEINNKDILEELLKPIKEIESKIKNDFGYPIENYIDEEYYEIIIPFKIQGAQFACLFHFVIHDYSYMYGVYPYPIDSKKKKTVMIFLNPLFKKEIIKIIKKANDWYGCNETTSEQNAFNGFKNLIKAVRTEQKKQETILGTGKQKK